MIAFRVVVVIWTASSFLAACGAAYLFAAALRDWWIVRATRDVRRRTIRRETSGIFIRSGLVRCVTCSLFTYAGIDGARDPAPITLAVAFISTGLSTGTLVVTLRDLVARSRIARATDAD